MVHVDLDHCTEVGGFGRVAMMIICYDAFEEFHAPSRVRLPDRELPSTSWVSAAVVFHSRFGFEPSTWHPILHIPLTLSGLEYDIFSTLGTILIDCLGAYCCV